MQKYLIEEELQRIAKDEHITAIEMNFLISKTKELSALKDQEVKLLNQRLVELEKKLYCSET